jgi:hypothetical protein
MHLSPSSLRYVPYDTLSYEASLNNTRINLPNIEIQIGQLFLYTVALPSYLINIIIFSWAQWLLIQKTSDVIRGEQTSSPSVATSEISRVFLAQGFSLPVNEILD